jgi:CreA protein
MVPVQRLVDGFPVRFLAAAARVAGLRPAGFRAAAFVAVAGFFVAAGFFAAGFFAAGFFAAVAGFLAAVLAAPVLLVPLLRVAVFRVVAPRAVLLAAARVAGFFVAAGLRVAAGFLAAGFLAAGFLAAAPRPRADDGFAVRRRFGASASDAAAASLPASVAPDGSTPSTAAVSGPLSPLTLAATSVSAAAAAACATGEDATSAMTAPAFSATDLTILVVLAMRALSQLWVTRRTRSLSRGSRPALASLIYAVLLLLAALPAPAEEIGGFSNDWTGNRIVVDAIADPKVQGITCHLTYFDRSVLDRLGKGNWFEDPSNSSISCQQTGAIVIGNIDTGKKGEEVFSERRSLIFKWLGVRRIYDAKNDTLVYVAYSRQVKDASAKMSVSTVALFNAGPIWTKGKNAR